MEFSGLGIFMIGVILFMIVDISSDRKDSNTIKDMQYRLEQLDDRNNILELKVDSLENELNLHKNIKFS